MVNILKRLPYERLASFCWGQVASSSLLKATCTGVNSALIIFSSPCECSASTMLCLYSLLLLLKSLINEWKQTEDISWREFCNGTEVTSYLVIHPVISTLDPPHSSQIIMVEVL
jgi:hypothetical protein